MGESEITHSDVGRAQAVSSAGARITETSCEPPHPLRAHGWRADERVRRTSGQCRARPLPGLPGVSAFCTNVNHAMARSVIGLSSKGWTFEFFAGRAEVVLFLPKVQTASVRQGGAISHAQKAPRGGSEKREQSHGTTNTFIVRPRSTRPHRRRSRIISFSLCRPRLHNEHGQIATIVMTGLVPVISIQLAKPCHGYRDRRIKSGDDESDRSRDAVRTRVIVTCIK